MMHCQIFYINAYHSWAKLFQYVELILARNMLIITINYDQIIKMMTSLNMLIHIPQDTMEL